MDPNINTGQPQPQNKSNKTFIIVIIIIGVVMAFISIGLLGTVAITSLMSAREKARRASALSKAEELIVPIVVCLDGEGEIEKLEEESYICSDMSLFEKMKVTPEKWSILPEGYSYGEFKLDNNGDWEFTIDHKDDGEVIKCMEEGCEGK